MPDIDKAGTEIDPKAFCDSLSPSQISELKDALKRDGCRNDFGEYLKMTVSGYVPHKFNEALAAMCEWAVNRAEKGLQSRVLVSCPPRSGKSMTISESLPSWFLGRNPDSVCAIVGYSADKAQDFGDKNRRKFREFGDSLFGLRISDSKDNLSQFAVDGHEGYCLSVGIDGGITGKTGRFKLIIVDDPYKNGAEAESSTIRERIFSTFMDSVMTRLDPKGSAIIVIHTRWDVDDLIGKLSATQGWETFNVPAVCEDPSKDSVMHRAKGEILDCGAGFTPEWCESYRRMLGERIWQSLYQGNPSPDSGNIFDSAMMSNRYQDYSSLPKDLTDYSMSVDSSYKEKEDSDKTAITVWAFSPSENRHYLLSIVNRRIGFSKTVEAMKTIMTSFPKISRILIENKANGQAIIDSLSKEGFSGIIPLEPKGGKISRAQASVPSFTCGRVRFPSDECEPQMKELCGQFLRFPYGEHDDMVDSCTQYLNYASNSSCGTIANGKQYLDLAKMINGRR